MPVCLSVCLPVITSLLSKPPVLSTADRISEIGLLYLKVTRLRPVGLLVMKVFMWR